MVGIHAWLDPQMDADFRRLGRNGFGSEFIILQICVYLCESADKSGSGVDLLDFHEGTIRRWTQICAD